MQNKMPLVSVVIPCYNHQDYVQDCIQSVIDQTYENIELIIIDDGSKDNSVAKIQEMVTACQERFTRFEFRYRPNKGLSATLNEALEWCKGKYFSAIASDDQMLPIKTETQVSFMEKNSNYSAIFGSINQIDQDNNYIRTLKYKEKEYSFSDIAKLECTLPAPTQLILLEKLRSIGGYNSKYKIEDWYSYLKLTYSGEKIYILSDILCNYRRHNNNTSKNMNIMLEKLEIIKEFKLSRENRKLYLSYIYLSLASDYSILFKFQSIKLLLLSLMKNPAILITKKFIKVIVKIILPEFLLKVNK